VDDKGASNKESGFNSSSMEQNMSLTKKKKINLTKTDPLSIKNPKKDTFKMFSTKKKKLSCEKDRLFRGKEYSFEPGVSGLESGEGADSDLEAEKRAEEKIDSYCPRARTPSPRRDPTQDNKIA
jgi:hypothetical protein